MTFSCKILRSRKETILSIIERKWLFWSHCARGSDKIKRKTIEGVFPKRRPFTGRFPQWKFNVTHGTTPKDPPHCYPDNWTQAPKKTCSMGAGAKKQSAYSLFSSCTCIPRDAGRKTKISAAYGNPGPGKIALLSPRTHKRHARGGYNIIRKRSGR